MAWVLSILLSFFGALGAGCAIAVPAITYGSSRNAGKVNFSLEKCDTSNTETNDSVLFGSKGAQKSCWRVDKINESDPEGDDETEPINIDTTASEITKLLEELWTKTEQSNYGNWSSECSKGNLHWKLGTTSGNSNNSRIWGYCGDSSKLDSIGDSTINFVELKRNSTDSVELSVCASGKECWTDDITSETPVIFKNKSATHWKDIKFFSLK
ncbi:hypothetical protein [Candidatus Mycoplasma haematominutum]|uniref:Lipoprotein n=1 Tax=Candidatus Mycoplasma haematominutum 'Birmingham 1' TaxID=1116213 RepID=G8C3N3_9MOLU|nr:hypothetical protein [Candidatus Mycoplasma haematominutum]CCE66931.1 hypothetical protein MHM_04130 [Candidatus Mycoplasma haematominutum 'Birmingham 1']